MLYKAEAGDAVNSSGGEAGGRAQPELAMPRLQGVWGAVGGQEQKRKQGSGLEVGIERSRNSPCWMELVPQPTSIRCSFISMFQSGVEQSELSVQQNTALFFLHWEQFLQWGEQQIQVPYLFGAWLVLCLPESLSMPVLAGIAYS